MILRPLKPSATLSKIFVARQGPKRNVGLNGVEEVLKYLFSDCLSTPYDGAKSQRESWDTKVIHCSKKICIGLDVFLCLATAYVCLSSDICCSVALELQGSRPLEKGLILD